MNSWLFLSLLTAHAIGDFYLQNSRYCKQKEEKKIKSWFLYIHSFIIGIVSWLLIPVSSFWLYALIIAITHLVIDLIKLYSVPGLYTFIVDQLAHISVLTGVAFLYDFYGKLPLQMIDCYHSISLPVLLFALLLCIKPTNIFIKLVLEKYKIGEAEINSMKNAGALIGNLERILAIIFVVIGQYEAIGFIIAAKSLLRFKDTDTAKTEYVLAGTFLSFGIAVVCGLLVTLF